MKILLIRLYPTKITLNNYNEQEIGLAKALGRKGYVCDIVSYNGKDESKIRNIQTEDGKIIKNYCLKGNNILKNGFLSQDLYDIIEKYDIIQTEEYDQLQNTQIIKKTNKPVILYHGPYYNKFNRYNFKYNLKCKLYDIFLLRNISYKNLKIITKSKLAEQFLCRKGFKNVKTIGVGLDVEKFKNICSNTTNEFVIKLKKEKKENTKYLLYVGRLEKRRNIKFLVKLLKNIKMKRKNVKLVLVGNGDDKYINSIFKYAKKLKVYDDILYTPKIEQKEISQLYHISDVFLLPTGYEIFGMVLLEAMYFGLPVVTTYNGGSSTIIQDKNNGYICEIDRLNKWVDIVLNLFENSKEYKKISENAKNTIRNSFTWDALSNKFIKEYNELLNKS